MPAICTTTNESSLPKIATAASKTRAFDALTYPEFIKYFHIANKRLYALFEDNEELHRLVHTIELIDQSNHHLEEVRIRQEQFAYSQFQLALDKGLQQRIKSLVRKVRKRKSPSRQRRSPPSSSAWNSSGSPRPYQRDPSLVQRYVVFESPAG